MGISEHMVCLRCRAWLWVALAVWLVAVWFCWSRLAAYSYTAGPLGHPPALRQADNPFGFSGESHLLVMTIHPKCPCSRASIGELEKLLSKLDKRLTCVVLVYQPAAAPDDWLRTDLVESVRRLSKVRMVVDPAGKLARDFGMTTSGTTVLYSPQGDPKYWGGTTSARGHAGDNLGSDSIAAIVRGQRPPATSRPAYGCRLLQIQDFAAD